MGVAFREGGTASGCFNLQSHLSLARRLTERGASSVAGREDDCSVRSQAAFPSHQGRPSATIVLVLTWV